MFGMDRGTEGLGVNVAAQIAYEQGGLPEWDGCCFELMSEVLCEHPGGDILWVDLKSSHKWMFHFVPVLDGIVHDAWHPYAMLPPGEYVEKVFPGDYSSWELNPGADR